MEKLKNCLACNSSNFRPYVQTAAMMHDELSENTILTAAKTAA